MQALTFMQYEDVSFFNNLPFYCHILNEKPLDIKGLIHVFSVIAKYAEHVRQTSADVRQRAQILPDILSSRVQ